MKGHVGWRWASAAVTWTLAAASRDVVRLAPPPVEHLRIEGLSVRVVRDDLCELPGTGVYGNKARKLALLRDRRGPLASYGGVQSNAALAMARLAVALGVPFDYYVTGIPEWLQATPVGNYRELLALGAACRVVRRDAYDAIRAYALEAGPRPPFVGAEALVVAQGGAWPGAEPGIRDLAHQLDALVREAGRPAAIVLPGGTGTTALFLARHVRSASVLAVPCVGGGDALVAQMRALDARCGGVGRLPTVLPTPKQVRFGALDADVLATWRKLASHGLDVDLVYGACAWLALLHEWREGTRSVCNRPGEGTLVYVHTGGLEGVPSQLARYVRAGMVSASDVEAPGAGA